MFLLLRLSPDFILLLLLLFFFFFFLCVFSLSLFFSIVFFFPFKSTQSSTAYNDIISYAPWCKSYCEMG